MHKYGFLDSNYHYAKKKVGKISLDWFYRISNIVGCIPQSYDITWASPSDCLVSYTSA